MNPNPFPANGQASACGARRLLTFWGVLIVTGAFSLVASGWAKAEPPSAAATTVSAAETAGPRIEFASPVFDFGKLKQGEIMLHEFEFTNTGTAVLEVTSVSPGCGCTTAGNWDRRVEPGKKGVIPMQFNSSSFRGPVAKGITVTCNDPNQSTVILQFKATVWKPFEVTPASAVFTISSDAESSETKVVHIVSQLEEPVTFSEVAAGNPSFQTELATVKPGKEFELRITAMPPFASASASAAITLMTSSSEAPTVNVPVQVIVQQPVAILPNRLTVPAGALRTTFSPSVTIRNHGTNALVLSDASINVPGVEVSIQETQPNRLFRVTLEFPAGFELKPDEKVEMLVKTNHPKFAEIRIPVVAAQRAATSTTATMAETSAKSPAPVTLTPAASLGEGAPKE